MTNPKDQSADSKQTLDAAAFSHWVDQCGVPSDLRLASSGSFIAGAEWALANHSVVKGLVEALEFYRIHTHTIHHGTQTGQTSYIHEHGETARKALAAYKEAVGNE